MVARLLIIGGYGHFGSYIARSRSATPCLDLIDLDTYLKALEGLNISVVRDAVDA